MTLVLNFVKQDLGQPVPSLGRGRTFTNIIFLEKVLTLIVGEDAEVRYSRKNKKGRSAGFGSTQSIELGWSL